MVRRQQRMALNLGFVVAASVAASGCSTERPYKAPTFSFMNTYAAQPRSVVPVYLKNADWWRGFKDPVLDQLVARALSGNLDLSLARERVIEARAGERGVPDSISLEPSASIRREKDLGGTMQTRSEASLGLSWMLDPYGARRGQIKAARARVEVADAEVDAARLLILFNVANAYIDLRYRQRLLQIRLSETRSRTQTLELTRTMLARSSATRLDEVGAQARLVETQASIPGLRADIQASKYQIAALLGVTPGRLDIDLEQGARQPQPAMSTKVGIPADLLRNRPDIRIAERLYYASVAEIGVAEAELYPNLSLAGEITYASIHGGVDGSEYYFGPTVRLPALPGSPRKAALVARESQARQAHTSWTSTVLSAITEVESALVVYVGAASSVYTSQKAVNLYREAVTLTRDLVSEDGATIRELLEAEESVADADATLAANLRLMARSYISVNVSLGSGSEYAASEGDFGRKLAGASAD